MHDSMRRAVNAKFDAGAVLRAKNNPLWRVFNKATIEQDSTGAPTEFRFMVPGEEIPTVRSFDPAWFAAATDEAIVTQMLDWLAEANGGASK